MKRLELIEACATGKITGNAYDELCKGFAWLKPNVEARKKELGKPSPNLPKQKSDKKRGK